MKNNLQQDVKNFVAAGGVIQKIAPSTSNLKTVEANENLDTVLMEIATTQQVENLFDSIDNFLS